MPYSFDYALKMARQSVNFAESDGDFTQARKWLNEVEAAYNADVESTVIVVSQMAEAIEGINLEKATEAAKLDLCAAAGMTEIAQDDRWLIGPDAIFNSPEWFDGVKEVEF